MLSNLPPGCTGNEPQIAGPDREYAELRFCDGCCDDETMHDIWRYGRIEVRECRVCLHESESEIGPDSI